MHGMEMGFDESPKLYQKTMFRRGVFHLSHMTILFILVIDSLGIKTGISCEATVLTAKPLYCPILTQHVYDMLSKGFFYYLLYNWNSKHEIFWNNKWHISYMHIILAKCWDGNQAYVKCNDLIEFDKIEVVILRLFSQCLPNCSSCVVLWVCSDQYQ